MKTISKLLLSGLLAAGTLTLQAANQDGAPKQFNEATVAQLQAAMASGRLTSEDLTREYIARISRSIRTGRASIRSWS